MLRWLFSIVMGLGLWLMAGTAGAQDPPPLTCPQTIPGQIDSPGDPKQTGRVNQGVTATSCNGAAGFPGPFGGAYSYDAYTFKNRTAGPADACVTITLTHKTGPGLVAAAYVDSYDPQNISANFIGHTGNAANATKPLSPFSVRVPALKNFVVVVTEYDDGGGGQYDLKVEGCGNILISEISPNFGPSTGGTVVTLKGAGFAPDSVVTFGSGTGTNLKYVSEFEIQVTTPQYTAGGASPHVVDVGVTANGSAPVVKPGGFTYYDKANTGLRLSQDPARVVYGMAPSLVGTITPPKNPNAPTGSVSFLEGTSSVGSSPIVGTATTATARRIVGGLTVGTHTYTATYAGDPFYNPITSDPYDLVVFKSPSTIKLTSSQDPALPGDEITFTATVRGPYATNTTGTVTFTEDNVAKDPIALVDGKASFKATYNAPGPHIIKATYSGDDNFDPNTTGVTFTQRVTNQAPNITITANPTEGTYGSDVVFTVKVEPRTGAGTPDGTIQLNIDGTNVGPIANLVNGEVVLPAQKGLVGGNHDIKATFVRGTNTNYENGAGILTFKVNKAGTTTKVESSKLAAAVGEALTFTATVTPSVAGTLTASVQFMDGTAKLGSPISLTSGVAKLEDVKTLSNGTHKITAVYLDTDTNFATSTSQAIDQVVGTGGGGGDGGVDSGRPDGGGGGVDSGTGPRGNASTEGGGCDCNTTGSPASGVMALLGGLGFALMLVRRRRGS